MTVRYVVEVFDINHRVLAKVSRSKDLCMKYAREVWKKSGTDKNFSGVYKVQLWECLNYSDFRLIKKFK
jgi:hypothetical protein